MGKAIDEDDNSSNAAETGGVRLSSRQMMIMAMQAMQQPWGKPTVPTPTLGVK